MTVSSAITGVDDPRDIPNDDVVEFAFRNFGISVLVQGRPNVKRGEYTGDNDVHGAETEVFARADPRNCGHDRLLTI